MFWTLYNFHKNLQLEEAKSKLEDYERLSKIQRNLTSANVELEQELAELNKRLEQTDKARKAEVSETKMRYEGQMNSMREELKSLHNQVNIKLKTNYVPQLFLCIYFLIKNCTGFQVSRFKRERDNYRQMLEAAQKSMADLRSGDKNPRSKRTSISSTDEVVILSNLDVD